MAQIEDEKEGDVTVETTNNPIKKERFPIIQLIKTKNNGKNVLAFCMKDNESKHRFSNEFTINSLKLMGLPQSIEQIISLIKTSKTNENPKMKFKIGFAASTPSDNNHNNNNNEDDEANDQNTETNHNLSMKYTKGDSLFVIVTIHEAWFNGVFVFELKKEKRSETEVLNDKIDDLKERIDFLEKENTLLKQQNKSLYQLISKPMIAQFKASKARNNVEWDVESIVSPVKQGQKMVTRENKNHDIIIGFSGFYNIIIRFGMEYFNSGSSKNYYDFKLNGNVVSKQYCDFYHGSFVCFNEYLQLKQNDKMQFYVNSCDSVTSNQNHLTIIRIGD